MSNARLRDKLERCSPAVIAAAIDLGHVHDECGILEFSYHGYCYPGQVLNEALMCCVTKTKPERIKA